jgi:hypothetical protein
MVGRLVLVQETGVRVPVPEQRAERVAPGSNVSAHIATGTRKAEPCVSLFEALRKQGEHGEPGSRKISVRKFIRDRDSLSRSMK